MKQPTAIVTGGSRGIGRAIATELAKTHRVIATYRGRKDAADSLRDETGCRPVYGGAAKFQQDPHWRDLILFYEYFHGDNGAGLGASHQTGWTGTIAVFLDLFGRLESKDLELGREGVLARIQTEQVRGQRTAGQ